MMLPYGRQVIEDDDIAAVTRVLKGDYLTTGPEAPALEVEFATYVNAPYSVVCANGTAALHIICLALGLKPCDQVIVPSISFVATANAPRYCGADVIFADVDPLSGAATAATIEEAARRADPARLKAIFIVHLGGTAVDLEGIAAVARRLGVPLIEDACHAVGTTYPRADGSEGRVGDCELSTMAAFSFHPVKTFTTGEGGAVTTRDLALSKSLALLRNHGLMREPSDWVDPSIGLDPETGAPNPWVYELQTLGYNYRLNDVQAALGRNQLAKMPRFAATRKALARRYRERFARMPATMRLATSCLDDRAVLHLMIGLFDFATLGLTRAGAMAKLREKGVGTQVHYIPIHRQPYYRDLSPNLLLRGADTYYDKCLSLPLYASMTEHDVDRVCDAVIGLTN